MDVFEFQDKYPKREDREAALKDMTDEEIDEIIQSCGTVQGKIYYKRFKKNGKEL